VLPFTEEEGAESEEDEDEEDGEEEEDDEGPGLSALYDDNLQDEEDGDFEEGEEEEEEDIEEEEDEEGKALQDLGLKVAKLNVVFRCRLRGAPRQETEVGRSG
jgi:hypothetical protein